MKEQELKNYQSKLERKLEKAKKEMSEIIEENIHFLVLKDKIYKSVQCMTVSHTKTKDAIKEMEEINTKINSNDMKISRRERRIHNVEADIRNAERY